MNVRELFEKTLIEIIEEIQLTKELIIKNKYEKIQNDFAQETYEKNIKGEIANAVDDKQKPIFSNQEKRDAEFFAKTEKDTDYQALKEYNRILSRNRDDYYMKLEVLEKIFEAKKLEMELRK